MTDYYAHETAVIDTGAVIGSGTKVWHFSHIFANAMIGKNCSFGQNTMVADGVVIGDNVKVQNNVAIYTGTVIEDDVFLGPSCVLTNVSNPRSQVMRRGIYEKTLLRRGTTVGANATIVCGATLGAYTFVAAGAVVTKDTTPYALMVGVPAVRVGWMSRHGHPLQFDQAGRSSCRESGLRYQLVKTGNESLVRCLDLAEQDALPENMILGKKRYKEF